jgi:hypothetical protein
MKIWRRIKQVRGKLRKRLDDAAVDRVLLDHELAERGATDPRTPIPGMRHTPDFGGHQGGV